MIDKYLGKECEVCVAFAFYGILAKGGYTSTVFKGKFLSIEDDYVDFKVTGKKEKIITINSKFIVYIKEC